MFDVDVGQKLVCLNGEMVVVRRVSDTHIVVEYKGKLYIRPKAVIGQTLFIDEEEYQAVEPIKNNTNATSKKHKCRDCMVYIRGDCWGKKEICSGFFRKSSREEIKNMPEYGDVTYYRFHGKWR